MADKIERDYWHPGFLGAMEIEFREYRNALIFDDEHSLSNEKIYLTPLTLNHCGNARC